MKYCVLLFIITLNVNAFEVQVRHENFDAAQLGANIGAISFRSESTKLGVITTSFEGRVLEFVVKGKLKKDQIEDVLVEIPVLKVTTDITARDEKMWNDIFEEKIFPTIKVRFPMIPHGYHGILKAQIEMKGKHYDFPLEIKSQFESSILKILGKGRLSLKALELPDPSILIASVKDEFELNFEMELK
jgi:hypothetical protein